MDLTERLLGEGASLYNMTLKSFQCKSTGCRSEEPQPFTLPITPKPQLLASVITGCVNNQPVPSGQHHTYLQVSNNKRCSYLT